MKTVEDIILSESSRGMSRVRPFLKPGYCRRAAEILLKGKDRTLIGTGFPVKKSFETDGPIGAIALYNVLRELGGSPAFVCAPPISNVLSRDYLTYEMPLSGEGKSLERGRALLAEISPSSLVSVERPGAAADGHYYNMKGTDITSSVAELDVLFNLAECPTVAFGDGGNEIGMGNVSGPLLTLNILPSVTRCDELVISTVSNWGVYGVIAEMSLLYKEDYFACFDPVEIATFLREQGSLDGVTALPEKTEDGFPMEKGIEIIEELKKTAFPPDNQAIL